MRATRIIYSRLFSKGNYENARIEIELEVDEHEDAADVYQKAKEFVENRVKVESVNEYRIVGAKDVLQNAHIHSIDEIKEAKDILNSLQIEEDLPF